ncbi:MAG: hypothetical protein M3Y48_13865 [Actinomycetota bacterium]|nr:hypothetical protein [Actinomycetota bacterium]
MATSYEALQRGADLSGVSLVMICACPGADCVVVVVSARELDLLTCPMLCCRLMGLLGCGAYGVLAAGLGVLVKVADRAKLCGVELRLVVSSRPVWRALRLTGASSCRQVGRGSYR